MNKNCLLKGVLALLSLCLISCQDKETASDDAVKIAYRPTFEAAVEQVMDAETKVYVDENLKILWHADDRVGLFDHYTYNQQYCFQGETGANAGTFSIVPNGDVVVGNELPAVYAVYPYDEGTAISNDGVLSLSLPAVQSYSERSFGPGANTMVSVTEDKYLLFKNLGGYLEIKLYGEDVTVSKIVLKGNNDEKIAGKATVTAPLGDVPIVEMTDEATTEVSLECATPVALGSTAEDYTEFWFVLPPTEFTQGFTITVYDETGGSFEQATEKPVTVFRNNLSRMSPVEAQMTRPTISPNKYLTFTSEGTTTISLVNEGDNAPVLYYSFDKSSWIQWDYSELSFTSEYPLFLCGDNPAGFSSDYDRYSTIQSEGDMFGVKGDVMSLINAEHNVTTIPGDKCFIQLFWYCSNLKEGPELPATTLTESCYACLFEGCYSLVSAPELPSTILAEGCYAGMFSGCSSLVNAPELPATNLASSCYYAMFSGCTSLTEAPDLTATNLADYCYTSMFDGCTSLIEASDLPAMTLAEGCYRSMFSGCSDLTDAPELPATSLADWCYCEMFIDCTSLTGAPELPATSLANWCYEGMFYGCTSLNFVKCLATDISAEGCLDNWLEGVSPTGVFVKAPEMTDWPLGSNGIPEGWIVMNDGEVSFSPSRYLTFTSEGTTTLALTRKGGMEPVFYYSKDKKNWTQWDYSTLSFSHFEPLYLYGENPEGCGSSTYRYCSFVTDGDLFSVDGDVMSLIDSESSESNLKAISTGGCFCRLFAGCSNLVSGPSLPATELSYGCYQEMFKGCTSLKGAPDLPATTLSSRCYESMFEGCTSLLSAPDLPATVLEDSCYRLMFHGCSSLSKASALPAESLAHQCYAEMFEDCSNLTEAPALPATTLANDCYSSMFKGSGLKTAPALPATTLNSMCYYCMFDSCASLTAAPNLPALNLANRCYARMFWGCTGITEAPSLPATTLADYCYMEMFHGCTGLKKAPALPAPTLTDFCYYSMFRECSNLYHVECLATDISAVNSRTDWLLSVSPSGTFVKSSVMNDWPTGTNGIPEGWKAVDAE